ncbi:hypothetical protein D6D06_06038 [Aureobasidium pullulans]|nr:hypothetical protein D6D06_06038 [Aureobasidium pullulans]
MNKLPAELKDMVCSFSSPNELKSLRLVSRTFLAAASEYILPRIFLFIHPRSVRELDEITSHPLYREHVTTIIIDPTQLEIHKVKDYDDWVCHLPTDWSIPRRDCFPPSSHVECSGTDRGLQLLAAAADAVKKNDEAWEAAKYSETELKKLWQSHKDLQSYQENTEVRALIYEKLRLAFKRCPKLRNIVVTSLHGPNSAGSKKKHIIFGDHILDLYRYPKQPRPQFWLDDILPIPHDEKWRVETLTICNIELRNRTRQIPLTLQDLHHLRVLNEETADFHNFRIEFFDIINAAQNLKTLWISTDSEEDIPGWEVILQNICLAHLEELFFEYLWFTKNDLVGFLLRHATSLRSLAMRGVLIDDGWSELLRSLRLQLPNLEEVSLDFLIGVHATSLASVSKYKDSFMIPAESFLLHGGPLPAEQFVGDDDEEDPHNPDRVARIHMELRPGL